MIRRPLTPTAKRVFLVAVPGVWLVQAVVFAVRGDTGAAQVGLIIGATFALLCWWELRRDR